MAKNKIVDLIKGWQPLIIGLIGICISVIGLVEDKLFGVFLIGGFILTAISVFLYFAKNSEKEGKPHLFGKGIRIMAMVFMVLLPLAGVTLSYLYLTDRLSGGDEEFLVLVSNFENEKERDFIIAAVLAEGINRNLSKFPEVTVKRVDEIIYDEATSIEKGKENKADMVIWGRINAIEGDSINLSSHVNILSESGTEYLNEVLEDANKDRIWPIGEKLKMEVQQKLTKELNCTVLIATGVIMYLNDDYHASEVAFKDALGGCDLEEAESNNHYAHYFLGNSLYKQGKFDEAKQQFDRAIELNPTDPDYVKNLEASSKMVEEAIEELAEEHREMEEDKGLFDWNSDEIEEDDFEGEEDDKENTARMLSLNKGEKGDSIDDGFDFDPDVASGNVLDRDIVDSWEPFSNELSIVSINRRFGIIDEEMKIILPIEYNYIGVPVQGLAKVIKGDRFGYINKNAAWVSNLEYEFGGDLIDGRAQVKSDGRYGFLDNKGKVVIPFDYEDAEDFSDGLAMVKKNGKYGFIDKSGKEKIEFKYKDAFPFSGGYARVETGKKFGLIDKTGKFVIPAGYDFIDLVKSGDYLIEKDGYWGFVHDGKVTCDPKFDEIIPFITGGSKTVKGEKSGLLDKTGKEVIPPSLDDITSISKDLFRVTNFGRYGIVNISGRELTAVEFDKLNKESFGMIPAKKGGKFGFLDKSGNVAIPFEYDAANGFITKDQAKVKKDGKVFWIDRNGKCVKDCP